MTSWRYHVPRGVAYRHGATPDAIRAARKAGHIGIDLDTRLTKDGYLVVAHWADLSKEGWTAPGIPAHARIEELDGAQVNRLRTADGARIWRLNSLMQVCAEVGMVACIEAKRDDPRWMQAATWRRIKQAADLYGATVQGTAVRHLWGPVKAARVQRAAKAAGIPNWHRPKEAPVSNWLDKIDLGRDSSGRPLVIDRRTKAKFDAACARLGFALTIVQGSYRAGNGASASAGTHDGGGVIDIRTWNIPATISIERVVRYLREAGFVAWYRTQSQGFDPHIHAIDRGNPRLAPAAGRQVTAWVNGRNGLANNGPDDGPRVDIPTDPPKPAKEKPVKESRVEQAYTLLWQIINDARKQGKTAYAERVRQVAAEFNRQKIRDPKEK